MSQSDRAIKKLATQLARLDREVKSWRGAQADFTSIEAGTMDINDSDGNLVSRVGFQDDGSGAVRFFDGPVPPVPSGVTATSDGPIIQATWDGTFQDGAEATYDLAYLEVAATLVDDGSNVSFATITAKEGASASVVADVTGDWVVAVRSVSQAGKKSEFATAGTVEVKLTDVAGAIEDVQQSANGKNNVTYSESPPTEADEGIVGDTWFVGATDSESGNWNIVAQYQYTADGWTQVELSHEVIATVDLGKATVGELDGIRIAARTITGDLFSGDAFDGVVFRGNTFVTRDGNGEFSDNGLFFQKPDGTAMFRVPTDGTPISMSASDVQIERAQVDSIEINDGEIRSGGQVTINAGVTPPASPPELNAAWLNTVALETPDVGMNYEWTGLAKWGDLWVRGVNALGAAGDGLDRIDVYNEDGSLNKTISTQINPRAGVTVIGDTVYTIGPAHDPNAYYDNYLHGYDLNTGNRTMWAGFTRFFSSKQKKIAIGNDGTNLLVAGVDPNANLYVMRLNPSTGAQIGADMVTPFDVGYSTDIYGVGSQGGNIFVSPRSQVREYTVSGSTLTKVAGFAWDNPSRSGAGFVFDDGRPVVVDHSGFVYVGTVSAAEFDLTASFTWFDGTHETTPSPAATIRHPAWQDVTFSLPVRAGLQKRLYVSDGSLWRRATVAESVTSVTYSGGGFATSTAPPTSNTFPASSPGVIRSGNDVFQVKGDGSGKWGPLTFNADGTMTSSQIPEWVPVTTFKSGYGPHSWGYAPAYRVWPDGKVEWRGVIAGNFDNSGSKDVFTIPVEARPPQPVNLAAASTGSQGSSLLKRVEFRPNAAPTQFRVYVGDTTASSGWVSLEGIFYYLT